MNDTPSHSTAAGHDAGHSGLGAYIAVFVALCVLTMMSFLTYFDFWRDHLPPQVGRAFMMAVSCTKAFLVIAFFMHLKWEKSWKYVLTIPTCMMATFLVLMLVPDVMRRTDHYSLERLQNAATPKHPAEDGAAPGGH